MREIKFRAWDEGNKIMHNDFKFISSGDCGDDWIIFISDKHTLSNHGTNPFINPSPYFSQQLKKMQFTGLLDKQGVEIYEGDIGIYGQVDDVPLYAKVVYDDRLASYCFTWDDNGEFDLCGMCDMDGSVPSDWFEVIGNIYENPELLEIK